MYDPLDPSPFADSTVPPWPTTPHQPNSPIPNLRRSVPSSPRTHSPDRSPTSPQFAREPQIYGQPDHGLISPRLTTASNGKMYEKTEPYLRVRITALDRNRRDILVRFDAQTNLANFTGSTYRNVSRSYLEFQQFYDTVIASNPQTIIPALPLAQTSAPSDEEDDRLVKIMLQRWLTRVCEDPVLIRDEELRSFIESDFGYQPTPRVRRKTSTGFSLFGKTVPDEDEELQQARFELAKLETHFFEAAKAIDKLSRSRKALSQAHSELGNKLISVAATEAHPPLSSALRKVGRTWHSLSDLTQAQAISECVILADTLGYQGLNSKSAKETLQQRTQVLEEYQAAVKTTISKRRHIERLKASSSIRPDKVDEAIEDMEEADKYEQILSHRVDGISLNLRKALNRHARLVHEDVIAALIEHARASIMYERQFLKELEALKPDVRDSDRKVVIESEERERLRMPKVIPKLEDEVVRRPVVVQPASGEQISRAGTPSQYHQRPNANGTRPPHTLPGGISAYSSNHGPNGPPLQSPGAGPSTPSSIRATFNNSDLVDGPGVKAPTTDSGPPLGGKLVDGSASGSKSMVGVAQAQAQSSADPLSPGIGAVTTSVTHSSATLQPSVGAESGAGTRTPPVPPKQTQSTLDALPSSASAPVPRPSAPVPPSSAPSLTNTNPNTTTLDPLNPAYVPPPITHYATTATTHPAVGPSRMYASQGPLGMSASTPSLHGPNSASRSPLNTNANVNSDTDPLGLGRASYRDMSQSVRVSKQQQRPRLDAREAASKLANFL